MRWAILQWHPSMTGASWIKIRRKQGEWVKVLTFDSEQEARNAVRNIEYSGNYEGIGGLEVLEYQG